MKRYILTIILSSLFFTLSIRAEYVEIDGITYYIFKSESNQIPNRASVKSNGGNYSGHIEIPDYIVYEDTAYPVMYIDICAFKNCHDLISIKLPSTPNFQIHDHAFANSGLEEIIIPGNVTFLGIGAFAYCRNLKEVWFQASNQNLSVEYGELFRVIQPEDAFVDEFMPKDADRNYNTLFYYSHVKHLIMDRYLSSRSFFTEEYHPEYSLTLQHERHVYLDDIHDIEYSTIERYEPLKYDIDIDYKRVDVGALWFSENVRSIRQRWVIERPTNIVVLSPVPPQVEESKNSDPGFKMHTLYVPAEAMNRYKSDPYWSQFPNIFPVEEYAGVSSIQADSRPFKIDGNVITFNQPCKEYHIYDINGTMISSGNADCSVTLDQKGVYIIMVDKQAFKIII